MLHGLKNSFLYSAKKLNALCKKGNESINSQGTGFFIITADKQSFLITNRHVIDPGYSAPQYKGFVLEELTIESYKSIDPSGQPLEFKKVSVKNANTYFDENQYNDIACLANLTLYEGITINCPIEYNFLADKEWINTKQTVCDSIAYPGFPEWFDHQKNIPIFRMGAIASDPRTDYCYRNGDPIAARIAYEGFSSEGASGSPVFATQIRFSSWRRFRSARGFLPRNETYWNKCRSLSF